MNLHPSTFDYHQPTKPQVDQMQVVRAAAFEYFMVLQAMLPEGPDKTYALRKLREVAMWANIAITREGDGSPRT